MLRSYAVQSFRNYLILNGKLLGLVNISEVILDDHSQTFGAFGVPKVFVTPTRCASFCASLHARVLSIHLAYNWKPLEQWSSDLSIFSPQMILPFKEPLNKLMRKLFSVHIVGRHPWLFGPLRMKLHLERQWFPSLVRSLLAIIDRSGNVIFRNKAWAIVKKIENQVSVYKQLVGANNSRLCSLSMSRSCTSDPPDPDTSDTLISALELVLKIAARAPCFKGACPQMDSTQPSDDEISDFPGLNRPSEDFASDIFYPDNLLPTSDSEEIIFDNTKPDSAYQLPPPEGVGLTDSLASRSIWDSVNEDEDRSMSFDVSAPRGNGCTQMKPELTCRSAHEDFFALDDNVYVPPNLGIFDEDANGDAALLLALN